MWETCDLNNTLHLNIICDNAEWHVVGTVEPLTNDHPHQRPSLSYDHISCDGQWFLFVYESLTSDHPSYTTTPMWFWGWSYKRGSTVARKWFVARNAHAWIGGRPYKHATPIYMDMVLCSMALRCMIVWPSWRLRDQQLQTGFYVWPCFTPNKPT